MVDTIVVGHLPRVDSIATVALGTMIFDILFWCCGFLRMSTTAIAAQEPNSNKIYWQSSIIAILLAGLLIVASPFLKKAIFLFIDTEPNIYNLLVEYFDIRIYAAIPTLLNYVNYGFLFGKQNTKLPLIILLIVNISAMFLDYIFVWQFGWQANGIAFANLITQSIGAFLGVLLISKKYLKQKFQYKLYELYSAERLRKLFSLNTDIFIRTLFLVLTTAFFTRQSAYLGSAVVAANMILMNLQIMTSYALDGFAIAAETLVGRAISRQDRQDFLTQVKICGKWSLVFSSIFALSYYCFGVQIVGLLTSLSSVKQIALDSLLWVCVLPLLSVLGFLFDGVFIGATWSKDLRNSILFASLLIFFPVWYLAKSLGNQGLWLAYASFMSARGVYLYVCFKAREKVI